MTLAKSVVEDCLRITEDDNVTVFLYPHNIPLAEEIAEECFRKGADVNLSLYTDRYMESYHRLLPVENLKRPSVFCKALTENSTAEFFLGGVYDPMTLRKIQPEKNAAASEGETKAHFPLSREKKVRTLSIGLASVTKPRAKAYGFDYAKWDRIVRSASSVDYKKLAATGRSLANSLKDAGTVTVTGPGGTRLSFDVSGGHWRVSDGIIDEEDMRTENFDDEVPSGVVYTTPVEDSASGSVALNAPTPFMGTTVEGLRLSFKGGRLAQLSGGASIARLKKEYTSGSGEKDRIAYFGIGFNPKAKVGYLNNNVAYGAVSIGFGGNEFLGGNNKANFTYVGTIEGATVRAGGKTIVKDGRIA